MKNLILAAFCILSVSTTAHAMVCADAVAQILKIDDGVKFIGNPNLSEDGDNSEPGQVTYQIASLLHSDGTNFIVQETVTFDRKTCQMILRTAGPMLLPVKK